MTTGISLVRENAASMLPPRSLWVSFPLGRPLGIPGEPDFQHEVIEAALALLNRKQGPVLADFDKDIPAVDEEVLAACPVSFPNEHEGPVNTWLDRLRAEVSLLTPWYELSHRRRGRTLVGVSGRTPVENVQQLAKWLEAEDLPLDIKGLKHTIEDLKSFATEAMTAQPGQHDSKALFRQFWDGTTIGAAILQLAARYQAADQDGLKLVARLLAPREAFGAATGPDQREKRDG